MADEFRKADVFGIKENVFKLLDKDWMLITAGTGESFNTMTASWGGFGIMWGKPVAHCVIRPQRYTREFMEKSTHFTLSFFDEKYRKALNLCGAKSGRSVDKVKETGLTPVRAESGAVYFAEARMVFECRKIYFSDFDPKNFLDPAIAKNYSSKDYHRLYMGEILSCLVRT